jgi:hypothetical protein
VKIGIKLMMAVALASVVTTAAPFNSAQAAAPPAKPRVTDVQAQPKVSISFTIGAVAVAGTRPYAFVRGGDGNLWVNWWSGSTWNWTNQRRQ